MAQAASEIILNEAKCFSRAGRSPNNEKLTSSQVLRHDLPEFVTKMQLQSKLGVLS